MAKSGVKVTSNFNLDKLPMEIPCPNEDCDNTISFTVADVTAGKKITCSSCKNIIQLNESSK